ncbi:unnamed protein product [Ectocarpus sp. 8 AP-2014]
MEYASTLLPFQAKNVPPCSTTPTLLYFGSIVPRKQNIQALPPSMQCSQQTERTRTRPQQRYVAGQERPPFFPTRNNRACAPLFSAAKPRSHPAGANFHHTYQTDRQADSSCLPSSGCTSRLAAQFNQGAEVRPATAECRF